MKKQLLTFLGILFIIFISVGKAQAGLEIFCPKEKEISYTSYLAGNYWDRPSVWGAHTMYGPWIKTNLNCGKGYVEVKWEIVDHYARSYYCTQTIWVSGGSASPISVWCPEEQIIYCDEISTLKYSKPEIWGYNYSLSGPWVSKKLNDCGIGSIWVEWKITDGCGKVQYCKHIVWVKARPSKVSVWWPKDFEADACKDNTDPKYLAYPYGYPEINSYNSCGKYAINYKDEEYTFPNDPGICKKILRVWTVVDWCTYNPSYYGHYQEGIWKHVQTIKVISKSKPTISCTNEVKANAETYNKTAWVDIPIPTVTNSCNGKSVVKHNSIYATKPNSNDASGNYPIGTTTIIFTVTDACGNFTQCTTKVVVLDKTAPTPYCLTMIVAGIGWHSDGIYTIIDPKKFDAGSFDNCTPKDKLKFTAEPARLNCDSLGIRNVKIWVQDEAGNKDFCRVKINLQDNQGMCPKPVAPPIVVVSDTLIIGGLFSDMNHEPLDSVAFSLNDTLVNNKMYYKGTFKFNKLSQGKDYIVKPRKTDNFLHGVDSSDYNLLLDFISGKVEFTNTIQLISADIDGNDTVNIDDAYLLGFYLYSKGKTILGQDSWRFTHKETIPDSLRLSRNVYKQLIKERKYIKLDSICLDADFLGIKIGDVNMSLLDTTPTKKDLQLEQRSNPIINVFDIKAYPNPMANVLNLEIHTNEFLENGRITIFGINGRTVYSKKLSLQQGMNTFKIFKNEIGPAGIYFYAVEHKYGLKKVGKITIF